MKKTAIIVVLLLASPMTSAEDNSFATFSAEIQIAIIYACGRASAFKETSDKLGNKPINENPTCRKYRKIYEKYANKTAN